MKPYYKIGELSKIYDIGKDSLMYYEEMGILNPIRDENGYRLYSIRDIWRLNLIKELRTLDVPMKRIKEYIDYRTINKTKMMLEEELFLIDEKVKELLRHRSNIQERLAAFESIKEEVLIGEIKEVYLPRREAILLSAHITRDADVDILMQKLQKEHETQIDMIGNKKIGALFDETGFQQKKYNLFEAAFCIVEGEQKGQLILEEGYYLTCTYGGPYKNNSYYIKKMLEHMKEKNYSLKGKPLEIYKIDIHETKCEEEFLTEIQMPYIKKQS